MINTIILKIMEFNTHVNTKHLHRRFDMNYNRTATDGICGSAV